MKSLFRAITTVSLLLVVPVLLQACFDEQKESVVHTSVSDRKVDPPVVNPSAEVVAAQSAFIDVYASVMPAVVNVSATRMRSPDSLGPLFEHFFGDLFKRHPQPKRESKSLGSGFVISAEGYILTNEHVIKDAEEIEVLLADGRALSAKIIGADPRTDVAVIKVDTEEQLFATAIIEAAFSEEVAPLWGT